MARAGESGDGLDVRGLFVIAASELSWTFSRSSGPGGQGVNTTDSRVQLGFDLAGSSSVPEHVRERALERLGHRLVDGRLVIAASEHRSQRANRRAAEDRLVEVLAAAMAPPPRKRRPTKPSRGAKERRLAAKKKRSQTKRLRRSAED